MPHTLKAEKAKQQLIDKYLQVAEPINNKLVALAQEGDMQAIKELHDRVWGKPMAPIEMKGEIEGLTKLELSIKDATNLFRSKK